MVALAARAKKFEESRNFEGVFRVHQARRRSLIHRGRERGWASHLPVDCVGTLMHRLHATVEGGLPARTRHFAHARTRAKTAFPPSPWHSLFSFFFSFFTGLEPILLPIRYFYVTFVYIFRGYNASN